MHIQFELREHTSGTFKILAPFVTILLSMVIGAIPLVWMRINPFIAYKSMLLGAFGDMYGISETLVKTIPLMLCGLAVALTAPIWNWEIYYEQVVNDVKAGTWKPTSYWGGLKEGIVDIAPFGKMVPQEVQDMVMERRQEIIDGTFKVWPEKTDQELLSMNYFIEGVEGELPK